MLTTSKLLDAAKTAAGITSDYRLARTIPVSDNTLYNWRHGHTSPDDERAARLAEMAGLDVGYVLASMAAERAKDEGLKAAWAGLAKRLEGIAAALLLALLFNLGGVTFDHGAMAKSLPTSPASQLEKSDSSESVYYVNRLIGRFVGYLRRIFAYFTSPALAHAL